MKLTYPCNEASSFLIRTPVSHMQLEMKEGAGRGGDARPLCEYPLQDPLLTRVEQKGNTT